jgi:hypothetical protein
LLLNIVETGYTVRRQEVEKVLGDYARRKVNLMASWGTLSWEKSVSMERVWLSYHALMSYFSQDLNILYINFSSIALLIFTMLSISRSGVPNSDLTRIKEIILKFRYGGTLF